MIATLRRPGRRNQPPETTGRRVRRYAFRGLVLLGAAVLAYALVTFVQVWRASRHDGARSAQAIVVLGAAQYDCRPSPVLEERLDHARALYDDGLSDTIVVTGGKRQGDRCTEASSSADYLRAAGVPDAHLLLEVHGTSSWESLAAAASILRARDKTDVVLVTDGYHALRVKAIADELGLDASVSPSQPGGSLGEYAKETMAVGVGRIVGFEHLVDLEAR